MFFNSGKFSWIMSLMISFCLFFLSVIWVLNPLEWSSNFIILSIHVLSLSLFTCWEIFQPFYWGFHFYHNFFLSSTFLFPECSFFFKQSVLVSWIQSFSYLFEGNFLKIFFPWVVLFPVCLFVLGSTFMLGAFLRCLVIVGCQVHI